MKDSHRTAIKRSSLSAPLRFLVEQDELNGLILDYGCGRGFDADALNADRYDPAFHPHMPCGLFDTIICNYVLNTVDAETGFYILADIESRLSKEGRAFIIVRRDLSADTLTQRIVKLDLPIFKANSRFCIYETFK